MRGIGKRGQVWIETVIYTLIALIMIGAVLAFARPKIQEMQDRIVIDQSFEVLENIDAQITNVINGGAGNRQILSVEIKKGELVIDPVLKKIQFILRDSKSLYSEPGKDISLGGKIMVKTDGTTKSSIVTLTLPIDVSIDYLRAGEPKVTADTLTKSPSPYTFTITNKGSKIQIEVK
jgi:type II secretory pathway pseudopilin PulG